MDRPGRKRSNEGLVELDVGDRYHFIFTDAEGRARLHRDAG